MPKKYDKRKVTYSKDPTAYGFYYVNNFEGKKMRVAGKSRAEEIVNASKRVIDKRRRRMK